MMIVTNNSIFGKNLKCIRQRNGFSLFYMAKILNISEERLQQMEPGEYLEIDSLMIRILQNMLEEESINLIEDNISTND